MLADPFKHFNLNLVVAPQRFPGAKTRVVTGAQSYGAMGLRSREVTDAVLQNQDVAKLLV